MQYSRFVISGVVLCKPMHTRHSAEVNYVIGLSDRPFAGLKDPAKTEALRLLHQRESLF